MRRHRVAPPRRDLPVEHQAHQRRRHHDPIGLGRRGHRLVGRGDPKPMTTGLSVIGFQPLGQHRTPTWPNDARSPVTPIRLTP